MDWHICNCSNLWFNTLWCSIRQCKGPTRFGNIKQNDSETWRFSSWSTFKTCDISSWYHKQQLDMPVSQPSKVSMIPWYICKLWTLQKHEILWIFKNNNKMVIHNLISNFYSTPQPVINVVCCMHAVLACHFLFSIWTFTLNFNWTKFSQHKVILTFDIQYFIVISFNYKVGSGFKSPNYVQHLSIPFNHLPNGRFFIFHINAQNKKDGSIIINPMFASKIYLITFADFLEISRTGSCDNHMGFEWRWKLKFLLWLGFP